MNGGKIIYVPIRPPVKQETHSASEWKLDIKELESKVTPRTKMIVLNTPHNPLGKMFSKEELEEIGRVAVERDLLIISDEVVHPQHSYTGANVSTIDWILYPIIELGHFRQSWRVGLLPSGQRERLLDVLDGE